MCVYVGFEYENASSFAVHEHECSCGHICLDLGKSSLRQRGAPSQPGTWPLRALAQPPHEGKQGPRRASFSAALCPGWLLPALGCSSLLLSLHFLKLQGRGYFFLSKAIDPKEKSSKGQVQKSTSSKDCFP